MRTEQVRLSHPRAGMPAALALREPAGRDELAVDGVDTAGAVRLLARLVADDIDVAYLAASDRDALLAALHRQCWGDRITSTLTCVACAARFDLSFELSLLQRQLGCNDSSWVAAGDGRIAHPDGRALATPCAVEELAAAAHGARAGVAQLAAACAGDTGDIDAAALALEQAAPLIDLELATRCAECQHEQLAHFDLQAFVLQRLLHERTNLLAEAHALAAAYGWSLREILGLPRSTRRAFAQMIAQAWPRIMREARR